jgi:peroxiredoxin
MRTTKQVNFTWATLLKSRKAVRFRRPKTGWLLAWFRKLQPSKPKSLTSANFQKTTHNGGSFFFTSALLPFQKLEHNLIKVGDTLPAGTLMEFIEVEGNGCSIGPNPVDVAKASAGKTIALFALPGAFTPTCSAKHVPGYVENHDALKAAGVDEIWCVSVNDAFVMGAWARDQNTGTKVRMLGDGSADFSKATGLTLDLTSRGMGVRSNRYSMLVKDGKVASLNVEGPGKFEVSDAATLLAQAKG